MCLVVTDLAGNMPETQMLNISGNSGHSVTSRHHNHADSEDQSEASESEEDSSDWDDWDDDEKEVSFNPLVWTDFISKEVGLPTSTKLTSEFTNFIINVKQGNTVPNDVCYMQYTSNA